MKWAVLLLCLLTVPVVGTWLRTSPKSLPWVAFALAFLPFVYNQWKLSFAPVAWPGWPEWPKGIEFTLLDFLAIAVILSGQKRPRLRSLIPWFLYIGAVAATLPLAGQKEAVIFYVWQLLRMVVLFVAAAQLARAPGCGERLLQGVVLGVVYNVFFAVPQYLQGVPQPGGAIGHQNMLGLMSNFALIPCLMLLLVSRQTLFAGIGVAAALFLDLLTASRATLALAGAGIGIALLFSCAKSMTGRKAILSGTFLLIFGLGAPLAWQSLQARRETGQNSTLSSDNQRELMKRAAWMIIADYPFGTGADQYVVVANLQGYSARAGVAWNQGTRGSSVHNSYLLVLAETGPAGLLTMLLLVLLPGIRAIRTAFRFRRDPRSEVLLGFGVAILVFAGHLLYEWAWILAEIEYTFAMYAGVAISLAAQLHAEAFVGKKTRSSGPVLGTGYSRGGPVATPTK